jgi:hypothetical protein
MTNDDKKRRAKNGSDSDLYNNSSNYDSGGNNFADSRHKKLISMVVIAVICIAIFSFWKPWTKFMKRMTLSLSNQSFITSSPQSQTDFKPFTEIYYKLETTSPFNETVLTIQIFKIDEDKNEILHKERQEIGIDPEANTFSFMLRPDYFKEGGKYRVKMILGKSSEGKLASSYDFEIK